MEAYRENGGAPLEIGVGIRGAHCELGGNVSDWPSREQFDASTTSTARSSPLPRLSEVAMPHWYDRNGLRFAYPENWRLDERDEIGEPLDLHLDTPGGGFWNLTIPGGLSPGEASLQALKGIEAEFMDVEHEGASLDLHGTLWHGFEVRFFCFDYLVEGRIWSCRAPGRTLVCHYQAGQAEFDKQDRVFQAVMASLFAPPSGDTADDAKPQPEPPAGSGSFQIL